MDKALQAWRDTLKDLGVLGFVREAVPEAKGTARVGPVPVAGRPNAAVPAPAPRPSPVPRPVFVRPTDPIGCPPAEVVAGCANLTDLEQAIQGCLACPLGAGRMKFVFGEGNAQAAMMFIGEGPGRDEDVQGRPFVGKAGELLDRMISAIGLRREETYIANIVKCRPPDNRTPTPDEARACLGYLQKQIELIQPGVIVTLGATPLRELLGISEGITRVRGQWRQYEVAGRVIPVMPTFHPAYVLRQYTQEVRRAVWQDLKTAKEWLEHPA